MFNGLDYITEGGMGDIASREGAFINLQLPYVNPGIEC